MTTKAKQPARVRSSRGSGGDEKPLKTDSYSQVSRTLFRALRTAEKLLRHDDPNTRLRACHAIAQTSSVCVRLLDSLELEARIEALEAALDDSKPLRLSERAA